MQQKTYLNEEKLRTYIKKVLNENMEEAVAEAKKEKEESSKEEKKETKEDKKQRRTVLHYFKQRTKDGNLLHKLAPFAYALWPEKDEANARSEFTKCLWGRLNDDGYPYSFNEEEINRLESMISSSAPSSNS